MIKTPFPTTSGPRFFGERYVVVCTFLYRGKKCCVILALTIRGRLKIIYLNEPLIWMWRLAVGNVRHARYSDHPWSSAWIEQSTKSRLHPTFLVTMTTYHCPCALSLARYLSVWLHIGSQLLRVLSYLRSVPFRVNVAKYTTRSRTITKQDLSQLNRKRTAVWETEQ